MWWQACSERKRKSHREQINKLVTSEGHPEGKTQRNSESFGQRKDVDCFHLQPQVEFIKACPFLNATWPPLSYEHNHVLLTMLSNISPRSLCQRKTVSHYPPHTFDEALWHVEIYGQFLAHPRCRTGVGQVEPWEFRSCIKIYVGEKEMGNRNRILNTLAVWWPQCQDALLENVGGDGAMKEG